MSDVTASDIQVYEKVSSVIGKNMDEAFKKIMRDLATRGAVALAQDGWVAVSDDDLKVFFKLLKGGGMGLDFQCIADKEVKGTIYKAANIAPSARTGVTALVSGEINFGGTIRF